MNLFEEPVVNSWKRQILAPFSLQQGSTRLDARALIDSGATGIGYIHRSLARAWNLHLDPLPIVLRPTGFNGKPLKGGKITHSVRVTLRHLNHTEPIRLHVLEIGKHDLILGQPWLYKHRVGIDYDNQRLLFHSSRCQARCLRKPANVFQYDNSKDPYQKASDKAPCSTTKRSCSRRLSLRIRHQHDHWLPKMNRQLNESEPKPEPKPEPESEPDPNVEPDAQLDICLLKAETLTQLARRPDHEIFAITIADIDKALAKKKYTDPATKVPVEYHSFLRNFSRQEADKLPEHRTYDHKIVQIGRAHV